MWRFAGKLSQLLLQKFLSKSFLVKLSHPANINLRGESLKTLVDKSSFEGQYLEFTWVLLMNPSEERVGGETGRNRGWCLGDELMKMVGDWCQDRDQDKLKVLPFLPGSRVLLETMLLTDLPSRGQIIILMMKNVEKTKIPITLTVLFGMSTAVSEVLLILGFYSFI